MIKKEIVNKFNEIFINIGSTLADKIPSSLLNPTTFVKGEYTHSFSIFLYSPDEVKIIVQIMANKKALALIIFHGYYKACNSSYS